MSGLGRAAVFGVISLCVLGVPVVAGAQRPGGAILVAGDLPDARKHARRVAVLPVKSNLARVGELFEGRRAPFPAVAEVRRVLVSALGGLDFVGVIEPAAVRALLGKGRAAAAARSLAGERYRLGVEYYLSMAFARAIDSIGRAAALYDEIFQDLTDPAPWSGAQLILGVAHVQAGELAAAHVALKKMFALQPDRTFPRRGFYGPAADRALVRALEDYLATGRMESPYGTTSRLHRLARRLRVNALVTAVLRRRAGHSELLLAFFRASDRVIAGRLAVPLAGLGEPGSRAARRIDAFLSRMVACVPISTRATGRSPKPPRHIRLHTAATSGAFYRHKITRRPFYTLGFSAGVEQRIKPGISWHTRFDVLTSLSDPWRDLPESFNSVRGMLGLSFAHRIGRVHLFLKPAVEAHVLGAAVTTTDPDCKFLGFDNFLCNAKPPATKNLEQDVLFGINGALGARVRLGNGFFLVLQGSAAYYFLPLSGARELNLPLFGDLGLGYEL